MFPFFIAYVALAIVTVCICYARNREWGYQGVTAYDNVSAILWPLYAATVLYDRAMDATGFVRRQVHAWKMARALKRLG